jgi:hypothetical protein
MKMSDRNTALHLLTDNDFEITVNNPENESLEVSNFFNQEFEDFRQTFTRKIQYICKPFMDAFNLAGKKKAFRFCREPVAQSGTFIMPSQSSVQLTVFYNISGTPDAKGEWLVDCTIVAIFNYRDLSKPLLAAFIRRGINCLSTELPSFPIRHISSAILPVFVNFIRHFLFRVWRVH